MQNILDEKDKIEWFKHSSKSDQIFNFFNKSEMDDLSALAFKKWTKIKNYGQNQLFILDDIALSEFVKSKLNNKLGIFDNTTIVEGNSYITTIEYFIHTDYLSESSYSHFCNKLNAKKIFPYKTFVIPLFKMSDCGSQADLITFKNRCIDYGCNFLRGYNKKSWDLAYEPKYDYDENYFFDSKGNPIQLDQYISPAFHKQYLSHLPFESIYGLDIEGIFPYDPGSIIIFDPHQLHCSANFINTKAKCGITICTYKAII